MAGASHNNPNHHDQGGGGGGSGGGDGNERSGKRARRRRSRARPVPLAPPPAMSSRKKARRVTTLFHRYSRDLESARLALDRSSGGGGGGVDGDANGDAAVDAVRRAEDNLESIGGRDEYQRASRLNTSLHSTSRWVVGFLGKSGWLSGIPVDGDGDGGVDDGEEGGEDGGGHEVSASRGGGGGCDGKVEGEGGSPDDDDGVNTAVTKKNEKRGKRRPRRRHVRLLEIGAVNAQLLDAATNPRHRLRVRAIDLHRSPTADGRIEECDFFDLPLHLSPSTGTRRDDVSGAYGYDAVVCSMVINSVPTPEGRGRMLILLWHHLRPGGLCFLTLPLLCLTQSRYTSRGRFLEMLVGGGGGRSEGGGVGFELVSTRESPKIAFFVLRRPTPADGGDPGGCARKDFDDGDEKNKDAGGGGNGNIRGDGGGDTGTVRSFDSKWTRLATVNRGRRYRNEFAVVLPPDDSFAIAIAPPGISNDAGA